MDKSGTVWKGWCGWECGLLLVSQLVLLLTASAMTRNGFDLEGALVPVREILAGGPPRDGIPALTSPQVTPADTATHLEPTDRVLGLVANGEARAYPIYMLNWHEVVNDTLGGRAFVVSYCPLCGSGIAYAVADRERFGVSGLLYQSDLLLYDRATESLWSQIEGRAVTGPRKGERLLPVALEHTTWAAWRNAHPGSSVLSARTGHAIDYRRSPYAGYERSGELMFPVSRRSTRLHPKAWVVGVSAGGAHRAYPLVDLVRGPPTVDDCVGGVPVRVLVDAVADSAQVRERPDRAAGRSIEQVATPGQLSATRMYWFAWYAFHPHTDVFDAARVVEC